MWRMAQGLLQSASSVGPSANTLAGTSPAPTRALFHFSPSASSQIAGLPDPSCPHTGVDATLRMP